jgi:hypothetical protein
LEVVGRGRSLKEYGRPHHKFQGGPDRARDALRTGLTMQLKAIGLAMALALTSTTAFAMGGGGAGVSGGVGSAYTGKPAECGGLVCFAKPRSMPPRLRPRRRHHHASIDAIDVGENTAPRSLR